MSRKREERRKKKAELARQLGVAASEVDAHHHLQENERVTRPELRLLELRSPGGVRGLLAGRRPDVVVAVYVVEAGGARLVGTQRLAERKQQLARLSYTRPAHFLVAALATTDAPTAIDALQAAGASVQIDGHAVDSPSFADAQWETARAASLGGVEGVTTCAAVSVRGVGRSAVTAELPLGRWTAAVELKL